MGDVREIRVLVVDDQATYRAAMSAVVDAADGFAVVGEAGSGEQAVAAAAELAPDLVLMDVNLPGIDGLEATRRVRRRGAAVVVLLSTYDEDEVDVAGCGAAGYIAKSAFGPDRLAAVWASAAGTRTAIVTRRPETEKSILPPTESTRS